MSKNVPITNLLSDKQLKALGEVAAYSAEVEAILGVILMIVLKLSLTQFEAVTEGLMLSKRLDLFAKVGAERLTEEQSAEFAQLIGLIRDLVNKRNIAIHGTWGPGDEKIKLGDLMGMMMGTMPPEKVKAKNKKRSLSASELGQLAFDLNQAGSKLWRFTHKVWIKALSDGDD